MYSERRTQAGGQAAYWKARRNMKNDNQILIPLMLSIALLSSCTIALGGAGTVIGYNRQPDSEAAPPARYRDSKGKLQSPSGPMSIGGHLAVGAVTGFVIDIVIVALIASKIGDSCFGPDPCD